ncbi:unnamed protein product [Peronospora farinosa]|uniref:Transmembrane protein n=1 Tax=Peronospora farinosa TaxID=134698 RepID=A0AAV0SQ01_9STRA|nr:unnamed protein product [Peronospora farinosa]CAI5704851.1 unnamed protein product [Peronospora farinosa]
MKTCIPERSYVGVQNNGRVPVTLDRADFTHEGFSLANDVRGIRLNPGDRFNVEFVFLPSQVEFNGVNAHLRILTTSGLFSLPISSSEVAPNRYGVNAVRASIPAGKYFEQLLEFTNPSTSMIRISEIYASSSFVDLKLGNDSDWIFGPRWPREGDEEEYLTSEIPGQYDKAFDYSRRAGRGAWDMPAGTTSPLISVSVQSHAIGVHLLYLHIATNDKLLMLVPVRIAILKPGIHIEPEAVDLGVLTDSYEDEARELFFSLYNAGSTPIEILEIKVLESKLVVAAQLRGPAVILAQTRAYHTLVVQVRVNRDIIGGSCIASLLLKTNASSPELRNRKLRLYGQVVKGHLAFQLNQTFVGVVVPLKRVFSEDEKAADIIEEKESEGIAKVEETLAADLVSIASVKNSMAVLVGTNQVRTLRLWNRFDCPVEVQRVWVDDVLPDNDILQEVIVHEFQQVIVPVGESLPTISLQITPTFQNQDKLATSRSYSLMVETNGTLDRIPIYVYNGFLTLSSTRGLHSYLVSGYYIDLHTDRRESTGECLLMPRDGVVPATPRIDGEKALTDTNAVHICRSLLFDLDKVASHKACMEMVEVTNENPVPLTLSIMKVSKNETVDVSIAAEISNAELFSHFPHNAGAGDKWNNIINFVSAGDSFVLQPGYRVVFHIKIKAKDTFGEITVPVMSLTTESEVFHLYARFVSVRGTIEPVTPVIVLPAMFPGRIERIQLQYRNTFDHLVTALKATVSSSKLQLLPMRETMAPRTVESVLNLIFYPWEDSACVGMLYFADCLLPLADPIAEHKCYQLSDYGEFVNKYDLDALRRRDAFWLERAATGIHLTSEAQVRLHTDIMDDVAEVTIKALLQRPMVTAPSGMALDPNNESLTVFGRKEFPLTGLFEMNHIFVHVRNPSNFSIMMELAIAEADDDLFYFCGEESRHTLQEADSGVKYDDPEMCLEEWKTVAAYAAARHESRQKIDVPPFYYQKKIIKVYAGEEIQLGPIYYLPSKVQEVSTRVFVRNDLTHIEPVSLFAQSGKGTLNILMDGTSDRKSTPSYYTAGESAAVSEDKKPTQRSAPVELDGILSFSLTSDDSLTNFTQVAEIVLSNTGRYGLTIRSVAVERDEHVLMESTWTSESSPNSDFVVTSDDFTCGRDDSKRIPKVLAPGEAAKFQVSYYASCFTAVSSSWLIIDTSDSVKDIRLEGTISTDAAFTCLRSRTPRSSQYTFVAVWMVAVVIAVISILYTVFLLTRDAWTSELELVGKKQSEQFDVHSENTDTNVVEVTAIENHEESSTTALDNKSSAFPYQSLASINRILADMEQVSLAPPACVVMPAVAELLERRRKELHSTVCNRSPQNDQLSKNDEAGNDKQNGKPTALTAKAKASTNKKVVRSRDQVPASDEASTARMASLRDAQNKVLKEAGRTDMLPATNATRLVPTPDQHFKCSSKKSDKSWSEKPTKGFCSSVSSSRSAIGQHDTEQSSRMAKLSNFSMDFSGSSQHGSVRSAPVTSPPPKKEETPFEAFKSLSKRWRTVTEQDDLNDHSRPALSGKFPGLEEWHDTLSFNTFAHNLRGPTAGRNGHDDTRARLYQDGFSVSSIPLPVEAKPRTITTKASPRKAPPGFTSADARPVEARAAFERFRPSGAPASSVPSTNNEFTGGSLFANNLPLFGPALPAKNEHKSPVGSAGCIGSGRSKVFRHLDGSQDSTK